MSNINWNQFTNNLNGFNTNNIKSTPLNQPVLTQTQQQSTPLEVLLPNYIAQLSKTTNELAMLNQQQTTNMLKDLLQFPKNFEQFLTQLVVNPEQETVQTAILLLASSMDINKLSSLLQNNSKKAINNLYQMFAQFNQMGMSLKDEQISQLTKMISFISASSGSDVQTLKTTMLMYLPWLPLTDPNIFKMELTNKSAEDGENIDDSVTILISTENYGNMQATVYKTNTDGIRIEVISSETFPQKDFVNLMREESKKYSININFDFSVKSIFNKDKKEQSQTQVSMNTSPGVNPFLLLISNALIKNVHEIDIKEKVKEIRKEKLDGKS